MPPKRSIAAEQRARVRLALQEGRFYDVTTGLWEPSRQRPALTPDLRSPDEYEQRRRNPHISTLRPRSLFSDRPSSAGRRRRVSLAREMFDEHSGRSGIHPRQAARLWNRGTRTSEGDHIVDNNRDGIYFNGTFVPYSNSLKRKTSNSRHKKARSTRKMARSRYASKAKRSSRRGYKSKATKKTYSRRPKGAYRGATIPKWMKGETKHILVHDGCSLSTAAQDRVARQTANGVYSLPACEHGTSKKLNIGDIQTYCLNPCPQGNDKAERNGRSIDGTYLRIQGHLHNKATKAPLATAVGNAAAGTLSADIQQRAYIRMLILSVKGGNARFATDPQATGGDVTFNATATTGTGVGSAPFLKELLFKKIDGSIHEFATTVSEDAAAKRVRSLQLPVNKALYTVLSDQTFQLSAATEGFGSSDILFDKKIKLKQRTTWHSTNVDSFQKNQLVAVFMTVDPHMYKGNIAGETIVNGVNEGLGNKIELEFESKYSYKDF